MDVTRRRFASLVARLAARIDTLAGRCRYRVPSQDPADARFDARLQVTDAFTRCRSPIDDSRRCRILPTIREQNRAYLSAIAARRL